MKMKICSVVAVVGLAVAGSLLPAHSVDSTAAAAPGAWLTTYSTPVLLVQEEGNLVFANLDLQAHDLVAYGAYGPAGQPWCSNFTAGRCPVFWSELIPIGVTTPVLGLENAEPLKLYEFYCTIHPGMRGRLVVIPGAS